MTANFHTRLINVFLEHVLRSKENSKYAQLVYKNIRVVIVEIV